jgi:hypothetical protein
MTVMCASPADPDPNAIVEQMRRQFPGWRIWIARGTWHARRAGNYRQSYEPGASVYALAAPIAALLHAALEQQADLELQEDRPDPERPPIDRARDVVAADLQDQFPGWNIGHDVFGWHATRRRDEKVIRAQSSPGLAALLPFVGD